VTASDSVVPGQKGAQLLDRLAFFCFLVGLGARCLLSCDLLEWTSDATLISGLTLNLFFVAILGRLAAAFLSRDCRLAVPFFFLTAILFFGWILATASGLYWLDLMLLPTGLTAFLLFDQTKRRWVAALFFFLALTAAIEGFPRLAQNQKLYTELQELGREKSLALEKSSPGPGDNRSRVLDAEGLSEAGKIAAIEEYDRRYHADFDPSDFYRVSYRLRSTTERMNSFYLTPNAFAAVCLIGLCLTLIFWRKEAPDPARPLRRILLWLAFGLIGLAFVRSGSKGGYIGAALLLLLPLWPLLCRITRGRKLIAVLLVLLLLAGMNLGVSCVEGRWGLPTRADALKSFEARLGYWSGALKIGLEHPLGVGTGKYDEYFPEKMRPEDEQTRRPHNFMLSIFSENGWPGLGLLSLLILVASWHQRTKTSSPEISPNPLGTPLPRWFFPMAILGVFFLTGILRPMARLSIGEHAEYTGDVARWWGYAVGLATLSFFLKPLEGRAVQRGAGVVALAFFLLAQSEFLDAQIEIYLPGLLCLALFVTERTPGSFLHSRLIIPILGPMTLCFVFSWSMGTMGRWSESQHLVREMARLQSDTLNISPAWIAHCHESLQTLVAASEKAENNATYQETLLKLSKLLLQDRDTEKDAEARTVCQELDRLAALPQTGRVAGATRLRDHFLKGLLNLAGKREETAMLVAKGLHQAFELAPFQWDIAWTRAQTLDLAWCRQRRVGIAPDLYPVLPGERLSQEERKKQLREAWEEICRSQPRNHRAFVKLGDLYRMLGLPARGTCTPPNDPNALPSGYLDCYEKGISLYQANAQYWVYLAEGWLSAGDRAKAKEALLVAEDLDHRTRNEWVRLTPEMIDWIARVRAKADDAPTTREREPKGKTDAPDCH